MLDRSLTPRELARRWRVRVGIVRQMVRRGTLAAIEINGRTKILPEAVNEAELTKLAIKPKKRLQRERIDPEILEMLS